VHVKAEGFGKPLPFVRNEGQHHDKQAFEALMGRGKVKRSSSGRPKVGPGCLLVDRSYSNRRIRAWLKRKKIGAVIPRASREKKRQGQRLLAKELYKQRNRVERLVARLKQHGRIASRYEETAESYLAMLTIASILPRM
jgi:transposase